MGYWSSLALVAVSLASPTLIPLEAATTLKSGGLELQQNGSQAAGAKRALAPSIKPGDLTSLIQSADKLVVYKSEAHRRALFTSTKRKDLDELSAAIAVQEGDGVLCFCLGSPVIALFRRGKQIGFVSNQSAHAIGTSLWEMDAVIEDPQKWLAWFDARGIKGPRQEFEGLMAREKQSQADEERWTNAMPAGMRQAWGKLTFLLGTADDITPVVTALQNEIPDQKQRILALLGLFGSGAGPWSGFPSYESIAEDMLLGYSTADLLAVITTQVSLTDQQLEGAARLFGGWSFGHKRPQDGALIPAILKRQLLEHSVKSPDHDKVARARRAFGS